MPDFKIIETEPIAYLYAEGESPSDPAEVSKAMGAAFGKVMEFMTHHGVPPAGPPLSVYYTYDPHVMRFRAGVAVRPDDTRAAGEGILSDTTPGGRVLHFTHVGPYSSLSEDYGAMMAHCQTEGIEIGAPAWEVYVDDPDTTPEERLRTEIFVGLA